MCHVIQDDFCKLMHLVSIDLSKNQLKQLPANFGSLRKLQHLDLYSNSLTSLPLSLCYMKQLQWLDLKDNPLTEPLKSIAGDCIDDSQCKTMCKEGESMCFGVNLLHYLNWSIIHHKSSISVMSTVDLVNKLCTFV